VFDEQRDANAKTNSIVFDKRKEKKGECEFLSCLAWFEKSLSVRGFAGCFHPAGKGVTISHHLVEHKLRNRFH
jgi:hypothetical protein